MAPFEMLPNEVMMIPIKMALGQMNTQQQLYFLREILPNVSRRFKTVSTLKPLWNGFMKSSYGDLNPGKSTIHFLPMIDMKATDYSCIYSTMLFVQNLGRKYSKDIVLTFDQPLYWKAVKIPGL